MILLAALLGICLASIMAAWGARILRMPGWRIVPGVLIAILLGPAVLGRVAPDQWEHLFAGGASERTQLRQLDRAHAAWKVAADVSPTETELLLAEETRHQELRVPLAEALAEARSTHQKPWIMLTSILAVFSIVISTGTSARNTPTSRGKSAAAIPVGAWSAVVPVLGVVLMAKGLGINPLQVEILLVAAAVAIGPWSLDAGELRILSRIDGAPRRWPITAARVATLCAAGLVVWAATRMPVAWLLLAPVLIGIIRIPTVPRVRRLLRNIRNRLILPSLAAMALLMSDIFLDARFWPIVGVAVLCSDGRWLGCALGLILSGDRLGNATMRGAIVAIDAAGPQLAIGALAAAIGLLSGEWITSLVLGACLIELTAPLRSMLERQLRTET